MALSLGVIVPCRNEALVIARKLRNLALCDWPANERPHRIVVVDDGSNDGTRGVALAEFESFDATRVRVEVVTNTIRPGKSGAIEQGLAILGDDVDLIVLTDADVVIAPDALLELARAFEREPRLGMATASQTFVESLTDSGELRANGGGELRRSNTLYDVLTARVRAIESHFGLVFSVHGQLMAWRRDLELAPTANFAADDLDLMLQVRTRGLPIRRVAPARFCEVRAAMGDEREKQAVRRARAFVQFRRHPRAAELTHAGRWLGRAQAWSYFAVGFRPAWVYVVLFPLLLITPYAVPPILGWAAVLLLTAVGARLSWMLWDVRRRIEIAELLEARASLGDRWETARR